MRLMATRRRASPARSISAIRGEFTIAQLAEKVIDLTGSRSEADRSSRCRRTIPSSASPDIALAKRALGWEPKTVLDQGLPKTIAYFRAQLA